MEFKSLCAQTAGLTPSSDKDLEAFKVLLVNACYEYRNNKIRSVSILTKKHPECLRILGNNKHTVITKPYKGTGEVIMNSAENVKKM